jgi:hypothetical protein
MAAGRTGKQEARMVTVELEKGMMMLAGRTT